MDPRVLESARSAFSASGLAITLGAVVHDGGINPETTVRIPLAMMNRHGLIAGATGTGKTKSLQLIAEQLSAAGVPVFLADIKGDVSGIAVPGERNDKIDKRGAVTLRYRGRLHHIGVGAAFKGWRVILLVAGREIRILSTDGTQLRRLTLNPQNDYQPIG